MDIWSLSLPDQGGERRKLSEFLGKWIVLYVYPQDDTPGCTREACGFRDAGSEFGKERVTVLGVSKDGIDSHIKFAMKYELSFVLLSDPEMKLIKELGAYEVRGGKEEVLRNTYIFDPQGVLIKKYEKVDPVGHAETVLKDIRVLKS